MVRWIEASIQLEYILADSPALFRRVCITSRVFAIQPFGKEVCVKEASGDPQRVNRIITQRLEGLQRAGVSHVRKAPAAGSSTVTVPNNPQKKSLRATPVSEKKESQPPVPTPESEPRSASAGITEQSLFDAAPTPQNLMSPEKKAEALAVIQREVAACTRCQVLASTRTQTVFGVGNPNARICFFGEAPGADEDKQGIPFVGRGGQLLTKMIQACKLTREEVYILNVLKCRPPDNRNPLPDETSNCRGYFERQLEIIRPEIICCVGAVAAQALLRTDRAIGKLRKQWHDYRGAAVICTYHPAYLLRNPAAKVDAWEDLKMMMRRIGVEL